MEVVFAVNTPSAEPPEVQVICEAAGFRYLPGPRGFAAKRNRPVRAARHDLIVFTGSDCFRRPSSLTAWAVSSGTGRIDALAGPTILEGSTWARRVAQESQVIVPTPRAVPPVDSLVLRQGR